MEINIAGNTSIPTAPTIQASGKNFIYYIQLCGEIVIAILAIFTNAMVLVAIYRTPKLRNVTNYFVASLSTADLMVGLIGIPCVIMAMYQKPNNWEGCLTVNSVIVIFTQISIFSLLVIAFERFYAIKYPFEYSRIITPFRSVLLIILTWILSVLLTLLPSFAWNLDKRAYFTYDCNFMDVIDLKYMVYFNFFGCVLTPLIIMICLYFYIFRVVVKQRRIISATQLPVASSVAAVAMSATAAKLAEQSNKGFIGDNNKSKLRNVVQEVKVARQIKSLREKFQASKIQTDDSISKTKESTNDLEGNGESDDKVKENDENIENKDTENNTKEKLDSNNRNKVCFAEVPSGDDDKRNIDSANIESVESDSKSESNEKENGQSIRSKNMKQLQRNESDESKKLKLLNAEHLKKKRKEMSRKFSKTTVSVRKVGNNLAKDIKAAKWFAVILGCFCICWLPLHIFNTLTVFRQPSCFNCLPFTILLSHLNSAFNPVLYALGNSKFAAAFRQMLGFKSVEIEWD